jgi:hypothetical protein
VGSNPLKVVLWLQRSGQRFDLFWFDFPASVEFFRLDFLESNVCQLDGIFVVLLSQLVLFVFELQVCDVVVAYTSVFIIESVKHRAHPSQLHYGKRVFHVNEVVVHALFVPDKVPEHVIKLVDFLALVALLIR